ncbi:MAG: hypothetical protein WBM17_14315, partial [Anaerolineales bacterium]
APNVSMSQMISSRFRWISLPSPAGVFIISLSHRKTFRNRWSDIHLLFSRLYPVLKAEGRKMLAFH